MGHPSKKLEAKDLKKVLALGMLGLLVAFAAALATSATFSDYNASRSVHWTIVADDVELIDLTPVQPYAYINETTGKLVIDFSSSNPNYPGYGDGISPASEYNFDEVFNVSNHLWEDVSIVVVINSSLSSVEFYGQGGVYSLTGTPATASNSAAQVVCLVLNPGEAKSIGIDLSADGDSPNDVWNAKMTIKAYRLGTEPQELPSGCHGGGS